MRSARFRGVLVMSAALLLLSALTAASAFTHGSAATVPFGSAAFEALWSGIEPAVPNFWGPALQPAMQEPYQDAPNGSRLVQYFDKARMEQTTASGPITNGLLTVELITGQRQKGDTSFTAFPPSTLPVVGDPTNRWPPYSAFGSGVFAANVRKSGEPTGTVYKPDGTFGINPGLGADPGAAFGSYQADPGGIYAHNIPLAFSSYLAALPIPWLSTMGLPLTEAVWVNVAVAGNPTWVMVQPFERRVLSYTPTNPDAFKVEMGNIGQHYFQWRYSPNPGVNAASTGTQTGSTTTTTPTTTPSAAGTLTGTPGTLTISSVQLGAVTDTAFILTFKTSTAATTEILYGTASHSYSAHQTISTAATQDHQVNLTGLQPGTKYYFALRATAGSTSVQGKEDFFTTTGTMSATSTATHAAGTTPSPTATKTPRPMTATPIDTVEPTSPTPTTQPKSVRLTLTQITVNALSPTQLATTVMQLEKTTVDLSFAYEGSSNMVTETVQQTDWVRDPVNPTASSTSVSNPLSLTDKQTMLILTATATIPFADTTTPPLVVTFSGKISPSAYAAGMTITSPPLNNARAPGYNAILIFSVALSG